MITLHGSPISNYYNKAKLALLEKGLPVSAVVRRTHSLPAVIADPARDGRLRRGEVVGLPFLWIEPALIVFGLDDDRHAVMNVLQGIARFSGNDRSTHDQLAC